jgi:radical SAM superfamily enzyme YgiQ (UPF0313 family)
VAAALDCDAVGISAMITHRQGARWLIKALRGVRPNIYICCGGLDPTVAPELYLEMGADCVVVGEADGNVAEVFRDMPVGIVPGVPGEIGGRPLWERHYPKPWEGGNHPWPLALPEAIAMFSRGCPYRCAFCANPYKGQKPRHRGVDDCADELEYLWDHGVRGLFLYDDAIVSHTELELLVNVLRKVPRFRVRAQGRCNLKPGDHIRLAEAAAYGLRRVMWGVESFQPKVLEALGKDLTPSQVFYTLAMAREVGLENYVFMMTGCPLQGVQETRADIETLRDLVQGGLVQRAQVMPLTLLPGTEMTARAKAEGWYHEGDPLQYQVAAGTPWITKGDLAELTAEMRAVGRAEEVEFACEEQSR